MSEKYITIPPGNHEVTVKGRRQIDMLKRLLKAHNYQTIEDVFNICVGEEATLQEVEEDCDSLAEEGLMWRYILNGEKFYVLNPDKKNEIQQMSDEDNPEIDPSGEDYEVK